MKNLLNRFEKYKGNDFSKNFKILCDQHPSHAIKIIGKIKRMVFEKRISQYDLISDILMNHPKQRINELLDNWLNLGESMKEVEKYVLQSIGCYGYMHKQDNKNYKNILKKCYYDYGYNTTLMILQGEESFTPRANDFVHFLNKLHEEITNNGLLKKDKINFKQIEIGISSGIRKYIKNQ